jgi:hypothetical protein
MKLQSSEQNQQSSLLDEIFIAPSKETRTDRFSAALADTEAACCPNCGGVCHC